MRRTIAEQLAAARRKAGLDRPTEDVTCNTPSAGGYRPRPIWDVPTDHGIVTRHGAIYADACAAAMRCGLEVVQ